MMTRKNQLPKKDVIRVKAKKYEKRQSSSPETKSFSVDPELTTFSTLRELLIKAFNIQEDFIISYLVSSIGSTSIQDGDRYLPMLCEWDMNTAIYAASDPYLVLKIDLKFNQMMADLQEWDIIDSDITNHSTNNQSSFFTSTIPVARELSTTSEPAMDNRKNRSPPTQRKRSWFFQKTDSNDDDHNRSLIKSKSISIFKTKINKSSNPMTETEFKSYLDAEGRLLHKNSFLKAVYEQGLDPTIRPLIWPHLLGVYPDRLTSDERQKYTRRLCEKYDCLKESWQLRFRRGFNIDEELRLVANAVRKDVIRTDRTHPFYAGDEDRNTNLLALFNLLTTYSLAHPEISYCQGMSDLASPLLIVFKDESLAYLSFCALMQRMRDNFSCDGWSMTRKFHHLSDLVKYYDPQFYDYLKRVNSEDLLFSYRWLLLELKREFQFDDSLRLMEIIWASLPNRSPDQGRDLDLYDIDLTAYVHHDEGQRSISGENNFDQNDWTLEKNEEIEVEENGIDDGKGIAILGPGRNRLMSPSTTFHSCPTIFACSNGVCPALIVRSLMLNQKENTRLHEIRHQSSSYDDYPSISFERKRSNQNEAPTRYTIGCWSDDLKIDIPLENNQRGNLILEPIFDDTLSDSEDESPAMTKNSIIDQNRMPLRRTFALRPSPELKVNDIYEIEKRIWDSQAVPMALEAYSDIECNSCDQQPEIKKIELTLTRIHEICLANIPLSDDIDSATGTNMPSSKTSSNSVSRRRSREPSGGQAVPAKNNGPPFTTSEINSNQKIPTRSSSISNANTMTSNADSGMFESAGLIDRLAEDRSIDRCPKIDISEFVNVDRDPTVSLPSPHDLGDGNPFMIFVCLTIILQNRDQIMKNRLDFNEIAVHFDQLMRKYDLKSILKRARILYEDYLRVEENQNRFGVGKDQDDQSNCMGISKAMPVSGGMTKYLD